MSNENDSLIDKEGIVHEKGWDGQYRPKQGLFGPARDTSWTGQPNVEYDLLGRPQEERDWLGRNVQSKSGETLYKRPPSGGIGSGSSASGGEAILAVIVIVALFFMGMVAATPIIAPILLVSSENSRKRGNLAEAKNMESWGTFACILAVMVVFGIAGMIGSILSTQVWDFVENTIPSIPTWVISILAIVIAISAFIISFITGISPTAVGYLHKKEKQLRRSSKPFIATRVRRLKWAIGITGASIVTLTVIVLIIAIIARVAYFLS